MFHRCLSVHSGIGYLWFHGVGYLGVGYRGGGRVSRGYTLPPPPRVEVTAAISTHPTEMLFCFKTNFACKLGVSYSKDGLIAVF